MKQESLKFSGRASNPATRKFSPAQIAAQKLFAERARAGTLKKDWLSGITPEHEDYDILRYYLDEKKNLPKTLGKGKRKANPGLYDNINAKRARIAAGSGERMRKPGSKGAPTQEAFEQSAITAKRNPDKSKPRAYVKRASQITGAPPSKRLVTRRKMALKAPAGYFPNPKAAMMTGYQVICMHPKKHVVGIFKTMAEAKLVARAMADAKGVPYAVKTVKVHKAHFAA